MGRSRAEDEPFEWTAPRVLGVCEMVGRASPSQAEGKAAGASWLCTSVTMDSLLHFRHLVFLWVLLPLLQK